MDGWMDGSRQQNKDIKVKAEFNMKLCRLQWRTGSKSAPCVSISDFISYQSIIKGTHRAKIALHANHFMNLWRFGAPTWNRKTTPIKDAFFTDPLPFFHCACELSWEGSDHKLQVHDTRAGWRKIYSAFQKGHMMRDWYRSQCKREE